VARIIVFRTGVVMTDPDAESRNFVLVHGTGHGGWCFARVADILRARGHRVFTPTLTGLGERSHLKAGVINCSTHIADVLNVIKWEQLSDVVLCGHSYGGLVVGGVADAAPDRVTSLVYLDAAIPRDGMSVLDLVEVADLSRAKQSGTDPNQWLPVIPAARWNLVNSEDAALVDDLCTPHPLATFTERLRLTGAYMSIAKKTYVRATAWHGHLDPKNYDWTRTDNDWTFREIACGHEVMLDAPLELADILIEAS
jgi:pimeloyl-ACP methyl ester carboxylesterase